MMIRDARSSALINTSADDLNKYKLERTRNRKISEMEQKIANLEESVRVLTELVKANNNNG